MVRLKDFKFKILVLGTSDQLRAEFLSLISQKSWRIDGVSGHFHSVNGVTLDIWFPRENASSKILASFSYMDANGVIIVMGRRNKRTLKRVIDTIHGRVGTVPFVAVVIRKDMSEGEKALKSLHAIRLLSDRMKEVSQKVEIPEALKKEAAPPTAIAGQPSFKVDQFGFVVLGADEGVPLFTDDPDQKSKRASKYI